MMMLDKVKPNRMRKLLDSANGMCCIKCGAEGTTRACHYNGARQHAFGKGRGIKCDDLATAEFCHNCDQIFTEGSTQDWNSALERSEEFLYWVMMTNIRRVRRGDLKSG